jgi:hypothetical protein
LARAAVGETPADPEEASLTAGSARYQLTFGSTVANAAVVRLIVVSILALAALAEASPPMIALSLLLFAFLL